MTDHTPFGTYIADYQKRLSHIAQHTDPNLSPAGMKQWRREQVEQARADLRLAAVPPIPDRGPLLDALRPKTADEIAMQGREREKIAALRAAGTPVAQIIAGADRVRLGAIIDDLEVDPDVLASSVPDEIIGERRDAAFGRLAAIDQGAADAVAFEQAVQPLAAYRAMGEDALTYGAPTMASQGALYAADPAALTAYQDAVYGVDTVAVERMLNAL